MRNVTIFFILFLCGFSPCKAAFSLEDVISASEPSQVKEETLLPPDPVSLDPNWWQYYSVPKAELEKRADATGKYYKQLLELAPEDEREEVLNYTQRILINLKALPGALGQTVPVYMPSPFRESYSFDEVLEMASRKKGLESQLSEENKELQQMKERSKKVRQHIDTLYVAYMGMRDPTVAKEISGLEIISLRMALAITEENIRISSERTVQFQREIDHLQTGLTHAFQNLSVVEVDEKAYERDIDRAKENLKSAQAAALLSEMNALGTFGDSPIERSKAFWFSQRAVLDRSKEALAKANLIFYRLKKDLMLIANERLDEEGDAFNEQLADWQEELAELRASAAEGESKTVQEYERSLKPIEGSGDKALEAVQQQRVQAVQASQKVLSELKLKLMFDSLMLNELRDRFQKQEGMASIWFYGAWDWFESCCNPVVDWMYAPLVKIGGVPITVMSLLKIVVLIALTFLFSSLIRHLIKRMNGGQLHMTSSSLFIIDKVIHYIILCIGFALTLASVGLSLSNLAIVLGALSVGIGFGLQTIVNNFLSSLIIMFSRTMKVGDIVELSDGRYGTVSGINIQNSVIHTTDGVDIILPNSEILGSRLVNWTLNDNFRRLHIPFSVAYGTDKELVELAAKEAADRVPCTVKNSNYMSDPQIWLVNFGDSALDFELIVWVNAYGFGHRGSMKASYLWELDNALRKYKIEIPYPQREVRVLNAANETEKALAAAAN